MSRKKPSRATLLEIVARNVECLVAHDRVDDLDSVLDASGFISNFTTHTARDLGGAIVALAPTLSRADLRDLAHAAVFHREFGSPNRRESRRASAKRWDRADKIAEAAVLGTVN